MLIKFGKNKQLIFRENEILQSNCEYLYKIKDVKICGMHVIIKKKIYYTYNRI